MSRKHLQELIKNLKEFYKCPSCEAHYNSDDIKVLGQIDQYCFVQLGCHACSMPVLATVSLGKQYVSHLGSDLGQRENSRFNKKGAITALEIAEFHHFLSGLKGGIGKISKKK